MMNQLLAFGPLGGPEIILIALVVLLLFGAKKLPQLAKGIGQASGEMKKARAEVEREFKEAAKDLDD
jgi:sec-independent protein translocase protein TatA